VPERVVSINGDLVPESRAVVSYRDRGFRHGDAAFDTLRTFHHELFRLEQHLDRLDRSLRYIGIDPGVDRRSLVEQMTGLVRTNAALLEPEDDYWVTIRVSRGEDPPTRGQTPAGQPTIVISCDPLPFERFADMYLDGVRLLTTSVRRTPPECLDPRAKLSNYLNQIMADFEAKEIDPSARPLMLDTEGNLAESSGANFFLVRDGRVLTPPEEFVLGGISRAATLELARGLGIPAEEHRLTLFDVYTADEAFLTATSFCLMPVSKVNRWALRSCPGPVVLRLTAAWSELVGVDIVQQAQRIARALVPA
jgi:branched-chain amino acid aminotransferase